MLWLFIDVDKLICKSLEFRFSLDIRISSHLKREQRPAAACMYIYCVGCRMFTCIHISPLRDTSNFPVGDINHATDHQQQTTAQQQPELETNLRDDFTITEKAVESAH